MQYVWLNLHSMHAHKGNQSVVLHASELTPVQDVYYNKYSCIASNKWTQFILQQLRQLLLLHAIECSSAQTA